MLALLTTVTNASPSHHKAFLDRGKMKVLGSIRLSTLIHIGALETLAAILICYGLAISLGHVKPWLPMISDCAVYSPEKYLFRFMMALSTFLIGAQILMAHVANGYSKVSLFVGLLASLGLGIVSVINEEENMKVHGGKNRRLQAA